MKAPKTRNANTMTEAAYWGLLRSILRRGLRYWKPIMAARLSVRMKYSGDNKRQKWVYPCNACKKWFKGTEVQVDHIVPVGALTCLDDLPEFVRRLTAEEGYQLLCKECHKMKTAEERKK